MPKRRNSSIKPYKVKNRQSGKLETKYRFQIYVGINPLTGKQTSTRRSGFLSYDAADEAYNQLQVQIDNGSYFKEQREHNETFQQIFDLWWKTYEPTVRLTTAQKTKQWFHLRILPPFGKKLIREITPAQVQTEINRWAAQIVRYKTYVDYLNRVFKFAMIMGAIDVNPVDHVIIPKKGKPSTRKSKENFWEPGQLEIFMKFIDDKPLDILAFYRTVAMTGLRRGELLALRWCDVDFHNQCLSVKHSVFHDEETNEYVLGPTKTKASVREVPLDPKTAKILAQWRSTQHALIGGRSFHLDQLVFPSPADHNRVMQFDRPGIVLDRLIKEVKLPRITMHGFRHTYATWMYETNPTITPKDMQLLLGHETIRMTMDIYTHSTDTGQQKVALFLNSKVDF
ncbi:tyrosine-type recombinase/integrase [Secundilactobacillus yichangensis]|uniref:tyrosine-type recombinase/integrase n=1 Tax=Secundilactobacillus yichangensis TaxID=2799580 RepID=UPI001945805A|nr:site-specific integrase [Secundilactobacillus yichangensis]